MIAKKRKKILIFGNFGAVNFGDEAILKGLLTKISQRKWQVCVISNNPVLTKNNFKLNAIFPPPFGLKSFCRFNFWKTLKEIKKANFIFFGGGCLFQDKERFAFSMWSFFLGICLFFKKKIALIASSIDIDKNISKYCTKKLFKKISFFSLRDQDSVKILTKLKIPQFKINLATDAAFFLRRKIMLPKKRKGILLILHGKNISEKNKIVIKKFVQFLKKKQEIVSCLAMQKNITHDYKWAKELKIPLHEADNIEKVRKIISSSKIVITSRLHGSILAMLSSVPFMAFSPLKKVKNFLHTVELDDLFIKKISFKELSSRYKKINKNYSLFCKIIFNKCQKEKQKTKKILPNFVY